MAIEGFIPIQINRELLADRKAINYKKGQNHIGQPEPMYRLWEHNQWLEENYPLDEGSENFAKNDEFRKANTVCMAFVEEFLAPVDRQTGPKEQGERSYASHAVRTARIVTDELGFDNAYMHSYALMHDTMEVIYKTSESPQEAELRIEDFKQRFKQSASNAFENEKNILATLPEALEDFFYQDMVYDLLAEDVLDDQHIVDLLRKGNAEGFTEASYFQLKNDILKKYMYQRKFEPEKGRYPDLNELVHFMKGNITDKFGGVNQPEGLALFATMTAQAVDNYRYPKYETDDQSEKAKQHFFGQGIDVICNLLPLARAINHPAAIRLLTEIPARAFFPEQWEACRKAAWEISHIIDKNGEGMFFDTLAKRNMKQLRKIVDGMTHELAEKGVETTEISSAEFEERKLMYLAGQWEGPLLQDNEFTIVGPSKKTIGSLFTKVFFDYVKKGRLDNWVNGAPDKQKAIAEMFKDPEAWKEAIARLPDVIRTNIVLGNGLSALYCFGQNHEDPNQVIAPLHKKFNFYFTADGQTQSKDNESMPVHFKPIHHTQHKPNAEKESVESRIEPFQVDDQGNIYFEDHFVMQQTAHKRNEQGKLVKPHIPFEIHIESATQFILDEYDADAHVLYKFKDILPQLSEEEKVKFLTDYRQTLFLMHWCMYKDAISAKHNTNGATTSAHHESVSQKLTQILGWIQERTQARNEKGKGYFSN